MNDSMLDTSKSRMTFELPNDDEEENTNAVVTRSRLLDMTVSFVMLSVLPNLL